MCDFSAQNPHREGVSFAGGDTLKCAVEGKIRPYNGGMTKPAAEQDPRVYFAAERTFLAWIRTGLALMGIGFTVARFGIFLREMGPKTLQVDPHTLSLSVPSGVTLVLVGVAVTVNALVRHVVLVRELREGTWVPGQVSKSGVALAAVMAALGIALAVYLLLVR